PLTLVDEDFGKQQLDLMLRDRYIHPNGQIPAYEWNFGDVNPPVQAWAAWRLYREEQAREGRGDRAFLEGVFHKLLLNFTWWVNRKDALENNVFEGGFLGLDNIGVFDRSAPLPGGGTLEQADGTAWMALYALNLFEIALELAAEDRGYQEIAGKFYEHFLYIAAAMDRMGENQDELWDEEDGFYYDLLRFPDGRAQRIELRSLVGLLPLAASALIRPDRIERLPELHRRIARLNRHHPELTRNMTNLDQPGPTGLRLLSVVNEAKLRRILARLFDEEEFLSPYGIRSLSRAHRDRPFVLTMDRHLYRVAYEPAESQSWLFGGNSNWRGPVWFPINVLLLDALQRLHGYYGPWFRVECPTGSGRRLNLEEAGREIAGRLARIFRREEGRRAVFGGTRKFQDCLLYTSDA
ncbi:MAG: glucosidase, partial [Candidatus Eisenbacteria bacterium]|nr:glucosidase [Candidatus Eisenbacteria bacterium]